MSAHIPNIACAGGRFDLPDRTFHSVAQSWLLSSALSTSDVKELIPEFFYLPEFLLNINGCQFGTKQDGQVVSDVVLPPWAHNNPRLFIMRHRQALESRYVSENLHKWIDLVFGYKQSGRAAVQAHNLFHPLTYEGAVVLDGIDDDVKRQAVLTQIRTYGQTPKRLFTHPHPGMQYNRQPMFVDVPFELGTGQLKDTVVGAVYEGSPMVAPHSLPSADGILYPLGPMRILLQEAGRVVSWGHSEGVVWVEAPESGERLWGLEHGMWAHEPPLCFAGGLADKCLLVSGGCYGTVSVWCLAPRLMDPATATALPADPKRHPRRQDYTQAHGPSGPTTPTSGQAGGMQLLTTLHAHSDAVLCVTVSRAFSIFATGGRDGLCVLWDLNRLRYVRALDDHEGPVTSLAICSTSGHIATVCDLPDDGGWGQPTGSFSFSSDGAIPSNLLAGRQRLGKSSARGSQGDRVREAPCSAVRLWTINGAPVGRASSVNRGRITCVAFSSMPEGRYVNVLVGGLTSGEVCVWSNLDLSLVVCVDACPNPSCGITSVAVSADGQMLVVGDDSGRVTWWTGPDQKRQLRSALWGSKPSVVVGKRDRVRGATFAVRKADSA